MVASVNGKFTNASAHTSYLILLKNIPTTKKTPRLNPFRMAVPEDPFQNLHPVLGGPAIIYEPHKDRQYISRKYSKSLSRRTACRL